MSFDFEDGSGPVDVGDTDTIIRRIDEAEIEFPPGGRADPIEIELVALSLVSVDPVDLGFGVAPYYFSLVDGVPSGGTMDVTFDSPDSGSFSSLIDLQLDLRFGSLGGTIVPLDATPFPGGFRLASTGVWGRDTGGAPVFSYTEHSVSAAPVPDYSSSLVLLGMSISLLLGGRRLGGGRSGLQVGGG